ncbi:hypothetical protein Nepgr_022722 [Nepenthes gracilis]|uniref:Uncharacterized protein n=1 Tax=Nepenthes gracilis TaxID=150966 RepID=A0AAD3XYF3_NEPGR|nr:hypothetical protein Nepgr_022722 [Nepenthes gracilis]
MGILEPLLFLLNRDRLEETKEAIGRKRERSIFRMGSFESVSELSEGGQTQRKTGIVLSGSAVLRHRRRRLLQLLSLDAAAALTQPLSRKYTDKNGGCTVFS